MNSVNVAGVGMTRFGRHMDRSHSDLALEAVSAALADAGCSIGDVQAVYFSCAMAGIITGQESVRGQIFLRPAGIGEIPVVNVENACASGATALHAAWMAMLSGMYDKVLVVGVEKLYHPDRSRTYAALAGAADVEQKPVVFMDLYAEWAKEYMAKTGATAADFARVVVKSRQQASGNPYAHFNEVTTVEKVLAAPVVSTPLTRPMCSPISDGAAACVLSTGNSHPGRVNLLAVALTSGSLSPTVPSSVVRAAKEAYARAGIGPEDVDVAEVHDAAAPAELHLYEDLGFCAPGGGVRMIRDGETALGGRLPVNPSGGLISRGHPVGATGVAQVVELTWQLRGQSGARQVEGARVAVCENNGGWQGQDNAAAVVTIMSR